MKNNSCWKKIIILSSLIFSTSFTACEINFDNRNMSNQITDPNEWDIILNLKGNWKFSIGDDTSWAAPDFNDTKWEFINVPSSWENEGFHGYDGYAWYRKKFVIDEDNLKKGIYLHLGQVDDVDEVYLNGKKIGLSGSFLPDFNTAYATFRRYYVPAEYLVTNKENCIAVRVYDSQLEGGIISGNIGLYTKKSPVPDVILEGNWKFNVGDNVIWKENNFDDSDWSNLIVPGFWEIQGFSNYDGFAWYRKEFILPEYLSDKKLVLLLGKVDDFDETFINGVKVGSTGTISDDPYRQYLGETYREQRIYHIPKGILKQGKNIIAVRIFDGFIDGGIYEGPIGIIDQDNFNRYMKGNETE
jgi:sialate O-acetylesterase